MSDWLWDGEGEPERELGPTERELDPTRRELEQLRRDLGAQRWRGRELTDAELPARGSVPGARPASAASGASAASPLQRLRAAGRNGHRPRLAVRATLAAAALLVALAGAAWLLFGRDDAPSPYRLELLAGGASVSGAERAGGTLRPGDVLSLDGAARARIHVTGAGRVDLEPGARLSVLEAGAAPGSPDARFLLSLERGGLRASIFAAPRLFQVDTPAGLAVDLGCVYTAFVEDDGTTRLAVETGQVAFEAAGRRALVPRGAEVRCYPGRGPGTPVRTGAPEELREAARALDEGAGSRAAALDAVCAAEDPRDALTLWHLVVQGDLAAGPERDRALARLEHLAPPPPGHDRAAFLAGDTTARAAWLAAQPWYWGALE